MTDVSRRDFVTAGVVFAGVTAAMGAGAWQAQAAGDGHGFMAASSGGPNGPGPHKLANPGLQGICALCEVTGGRRRFTASQWNTM